MPNIQIISVQEPKEDCLLYCSSVSPQPFAAGELLIYRHFSRLQGHDLVLVTPENKPPGKLENVLDQILVPPASIWFSRLKRHWLYPVGDWLIARHIRRRFEVVANRIKPAVVLTTFVPDAFMTAAASYAQDCGLPLVLICHDDYEDFTPSSFHPRLAAIYRQATVRLCVSEPMAVEFERRYGVDGVVLHPIPSGPAKSPAEEKPGAQLRIGFAGSIGAGYQEALLQLAEAVGSVGGQILIVSPTPRNSLQRLWSHPALTDLGMVSPIEVRSVFRKAEVNVLAVVQSFDPRDERAFQFNFPSKLTEYSTFGLPLLIVGPDSASAVKWAKSHGEIAVISTGAPAQLTSSVKRLIDSETRLKLAQAFYKAAVEFAPEQLQAIFESAIESAMLEHPALQAKSAVAGWMA